MSSVTCASHDPVMRTTRLESALRTQGDVDVEAAHDLVARESELATLETVLAGADEQPRVVVIEGAAGIGKSCVLDWAVRRAATLSHRVLRCRPAEAEADLAYAALGDLLATVAEE